MALDPVAKAIISILATRTKPQIQQIASYYKSNYARDLVDDFQDMDRTEFGVLCKGLAMRSGEFEALGVWEAVVRIWIEFEAL
jgi:hypothetical protein